VRTAVACQQCKQCSKKQALTSALRHDKIGGVQTANDEGQTNIDFFAKRIAWTRASKRIKMRCSKIDFAQWMN